MEYWQARVTMENGAVVVFGLQAPDATGAWQQAGELLAEFSQPAGDFELTCLAR